MGDSESTKAEGAALTVWLVSFGETDDRELRPPQIAEALRRGEIGEETIVWREDLPEWVALGSVPELAQLLPASGLTANAPAKPLASLKPPFPSKAQAPAEKAPPPGSEEEQPVSVSPESVDPISSESLGRAEALSAGTLAAPKRGMPAPPLAPQRELVPEPRSEPEEEAPPSSGTPSLRTLVGPIRTTSRRVDDEIMNLGGRGPEAFGPPTIDLVSAPATPEQTPVEDAVTAPVAGAAEPERDAASPAAAPQGSRPEQVPAKKRSSLAWFALGAVAVAVPALALRGKPPEPSVQSRQTEMAATVVASVSPQPAEPTRAEPAAASAPSVEAKATASSPAVPVPATTSTTTAPPIAAAPVAPLATTPVVKLDRPKQSSDMAPATPSAAPAPAAAPKPSAAPAPTDKAEPEGPAFDVAAAQAALAAAAAQAASCRKEGDPAGSAGVRVTFSNSGNASRAIIEGPPFAGTETGSCIAAAMRTAKVPAYSGDRVTVFKHVTVQ